MHMRTESGFICCIKKKKKHWAAKNSRIREKKFNL